MHSDFDVNRTVSGLDCCGFKINNYTYMYLQWPKERETQIVLTARKGMPKKM